MPEKPWIRTFDFFENARDYLKLPNHDVRMIDTYGLGQFDVVTCFGLRRGKDQSIYVSLHSRQRQRRHEWAFWVLIESLSKALVRVLNLGSVGFER